MAKRLTARSVELAKPNPQKRVEIPDAGKPGLYLVIQPNGKKSWAVRYRRPSDRAPRKLTLPGFPSLGLAHRLAQAALDCVAEGGDPAEEKQIEKAKRRAGEQNSDTVEGMFHEFLDRHTRRKDGKPIRERTRQATARMLGFKRNPKNPAQWIGTGNGAAERWKSRTIRDIKKSDVRDLVDDIAEKIGPVAANRTLAALKTAFRWRVDRDNETFPKSPCDGVQAPAPETARERVLADAELAALWRAAGTFDGPFGSMVQILILTGCRRDEVRGALWAEFDLPAQTWTIPAHRTKNGHPHIVPLSDQAMVVLESVPRLGKVGFVFTKNGENIIGGLGLAKGLLDQAMAGELGEIPQPWVLHDIRRTFVTGLQRLGVRLEVAEAAVNHRSGSVSGVTAIYAKHDYAEEKRAAMAAWAREVERIVAGKSAQVISLARRPAK
jgi:integrase